MNDRKFFQLCTQWNLQGESKLLPEQPSLEGFSPGYTSYTVCSTCTHLNRVLYSGKLSREKTFTNFEVLWLFTKFFSAKFRGVASFGGTCEQFAKVFSHKSFPLYGSRNVFRILGSGSFSVFAYGYLVYIGTCSFRSCTVFRAA